VIKRSNGIYVFENFPANTEGPVSYDKHYEGLLIRKIKGVWKIDQYLYNNIPTEILGDSGD
jgi:hypothetical protein